MNTRIFPTDIYQQLDGYDFRLLDELAFLCKQQRRRTGALYCCPGREYLARKVNCDIGTISRHTTKLEKLGLLEKLQRRPVRGQWRTCLYKLRHWTSWRLGQIAGMLRKVGKVRTTEKSSHRVRQDARIASVRTEIKTPTYYRAQKPASGTGEFIKTNAILQRWLQRGTESD